MLSLPITFPSAMGICAPVFSRPVWQPVTVRMTGAVLAPGKQTVPAILRRMGRSAAPDFQPSQRVLNRAGWSPRTASRLLRRLLVAVCSPGGVVVCGLEDTIERRRGDQMKAKGLSRAPVRSSHAHVVTVSGLRWLACLVLVPLSWAHRVWALPLLTVLGPSERFSAQRGRRHQPRTARAWQRRRRVVRWLPGREIAWGTDSRLAALELRDNVQTLPRASVITRLRLAAARSDPPPPRAPGQTGRPRLTGKRRPTLEAVWADERTHWTPMRVAQWYGAGPREVEVPPDTAVWYHAGTPPVTIRWGLMRDPTEDCTPQALLSTTPAHPPEQLLTWCVRRWTMEVPLEAARAHLGMDTQRPWHERASARPTPALLRLDSISTLTAQLLIEQGATCLRSTAWSRKPRPTFSEARAWVRRHVWEHSHFSMSQQETVLTR